MPRAPPGGGLRGRHSYAFDTTRLGSQSLLRGRLTSGPHLAGPASLLPELTLILFDSRYRIRLCCVCTEGVLLYPVEFPFVRAIRVCVTLSLELYGLLVSYQVINILSPHHGDYSSWAAWQPLGGVEQGGWLGLGVRGSASS